jgi:tRNA A-37 threonylcarbamoyl transferase component Bud32/tetratricopeptide (TPR) repeat protein/TolB-like protein
MIAERLKASLADRYRIDRELGQGGMATVYLAQDLKHDRKVAIKVLHPELAHALGPERFLREITIAAQFDHPYILPLLDSGVVEPGPADHSPRLLYYVMPYVEGESLRHRIERQKQMPLEDALQVAHEVAEALGYAHARGVIHRDIKPENILLSGGHARVADFGIARAIDVAGSERLTETGLAIGTPAYMSPEQSMAERELDGRSDLYALGCVLYEMLAGEPPYTGPTAQAIFAKRMTNPVPTVRTVREAVPEWVDRALASALARSPADRFPTATQFAEALSQSSTTAPVKAGVIHVRARGWVAGVGALLAFTLLGGWLGARALRPQVAPSASVIAVLPFLPSSADTTLMRLGRDLVLTISANLDGVGGIRTADPRLILSKSDDSRSGRAAVDAVALGKSLGAGSVVVGDIVRVGPDVRLDLRLVSTSGDSQPLARASITSPLDSIPALTDSVTWALLRQVWRRGDPPSPSYANLTTRSVTSLRAFLEGEQLVVAGRWPEAIDAYDRAIKADSTFWLAGWRFNQAQGWILHGNADPELQRRAVSHREAFGEVDRLLIEADMTGDTVTHVELLARLRRITQKFPDDWSAWFKYADNLLHWGPMVGITSAEARAALQHTVDLNPRLVPIWDHLFDASVGHDSAQAAGALKALTALGYFTYRSSELGYDATLKPRLWMSASGGLPPQLRDSFAIAVVGSTNWLVRIFAGVDLYTHGYPAAQIEFNRRLIALAPHDSLTHYVWEGMASAWAARGAWDSTLVAFDHWAAADNRGSFDQGILPLMYEIAAAGAWLGGLDPAQAADRRTAAVKFLAGLPPDSRDAKVAQARVAWADGMLAVLRRDLRGLREARARVQQSGATGAPFVERSLAGFELELTGAKQAAAESLAALDLAATDSAISWPHDPYARSITHLEASRLLLERGDTTRAVKLLAWHQASIPASAEGLRSQIFAGLAYYELARIEEALGRIDLARDHYQQFLRRYDMPPPAHQYLVDEANAALRRLSGEQRKNARLE